jgi:hypothetical protein
LFELWQGDPRQIGAWKIFARWSSDPTQQIYVGRDETKSLGLVKLLPLEVLGGENREHAFQSLADVLIHKQGKSLQGLLEVDLNGAEPWAAWQIIEGCSFRDLKPKEIENFNPRAILALTYLLSDALQDLHAHGLSLGALTPESVWLTKKQPVIETLELTQLGTNSQRNARGWSRETLQWLAPEQLISEGGTTQSDVFSLGLFISWLSTGVGLFEDTSSAELIEILRTGNFDLNGLPLEIRSLVTRMLEMDPTKRIQASEIVWELAQSGWTSEKATGAWQSLPRFDEISTKKIHKEVKKLEPTPRKTILSRTKSFLPLVAFATGIVSAAFTIQNLADSNSDPALTYEPAIQGRPPVTITYLIPDIYDVDFQDDQVKPGLAVTCNDAPHTTFDGLRCEDESGTVYEPCYFYGGEFIFEAYCFNLVTFEYTKHEVTSQEIATPYLADYPVGFETGRVPGYLFIIPPGKEPSDEELDRCTLESVEGYISGEPQYSCESGGKVTSDLLGSKPNKFVRYVFEDGKESSAWVRFQVFS